MCQLVIVLVWGGSRNESLLVSCVALAAMLVCSGGVLAGDDVNIQVSPNVINLKAPVPSVTIHADTPFSWVAGGVTRNGVSASSIFADDCGNLVAKFPAEDIEAGIDDDDIGTNVEMTLVGNLKYDGTFVETDFVKVISVKGK
ncbi:MAG: hypothetical protein ACYC6N_19475 [Pirellulaceae bacterium]